MSFDCMFVFTLKTLMAALGGVSLVMTSAWREVQAVGCCGPRQWAAEVRFVTMDTKSGSGRTTESWHWMSYDLDRQQIGVINFDPHHSDFYQRELLDYTRGKRYVTPDEFKCSVTPLIGTMEQLCVPPPEGVVTQNVTMHFGVYPEPGTTLDLQQDLQDGLGLYAETIYYATHNVTGYVTVSSLTCSFVNEMTYAFNDDGSLQWSHSQWNNITLFVDDSAFVMPKSCYTTDLGINAEYQTIAARQSAGPGFMGKTVFRQP